MAKRRLTSILNLLRRIALLILLLLAVLLGYGLIRESLYRSQVSEEQPPPGRMVALDTHALHLHCEGSGVPTVILEADLDAIGAQTWSLVQGELAADSRTCSYDRAGIMWSEPGLPPRDGERIAAELKALLEAAGEEGPFLLIGHAAGGAYVRIFAGQNRDSICGLLLVDSVHPDQVARFVETGAKYKAPSSQIRPLVVLLSHLGRPKRYSGPKPRTLTDEVYEAMQARLPQSSVAWYDETVAGTATLDQARKVQSLGDLPLIVLSSGRPASSIAPLPVEMAGGRDPQELWLELQAELAELSTESEIRVLKDSGHYIQFDRPDKVIQAVRDLIGRCREN